MLVISRIFKKTWTNNSIASSNNDDGKRKKVYPNAASIDNYVKSNFERAYMYPSTHPTPSKRADSVR